MRYHRGGPFCITKDAGHQTSNLHITGPITTKLKEQKDSFTIAHQNINRLNNKTFKLECELQVNNKIDVLCLSEHWLTKHQLEAVNIMNYKLSAGFSRTLKNGGGVCIYSKSSLLTLERKEVSDLSIDSVFEACAVEYVGLGTIVICIYKPPTPPGEINNFKLFISKLNQLIDLPIFKQYKVTILGDFNIDLLSKTTEKKVLLDTLKTTGMRALVSFPTRICKTTKTCIDHAYTNVPIEHVLSVEPYDMFVSDHKCIIVKLSITKTLQLNTVTWKRMFSETNKHNFINSLFNYDWDRILSKQTQPDLLFNSFVNVITHLHDINFPLKKYPVRNIAKVWASESVKSARNRLRIAKTSAASSTTPLQPCYDLLALESMYVAELCATRKQYINNLISKSTNICQTSWRVIASETGRNNAKNDALDILISESVGQSAESRAAATAAALNRFYIDANNNTGARADIPAALCYLGRYVNKYADLITIEPFDTQLVEKTLHKIKRKDSKDINDMSTRSLDLIPTFVISMLCNLFNRCIETGTYPSNLKNVKVQPIYKGKGELNRLKNFRPISLIPLFSKVFENLLCEKLMSHFNLNNLINRQQYAYQPGKSTTDAARDVVTKVTGHLDAGRQVAAIFCDLSRAFELVAHPLILAKLDHYGVKGNYLKIITSFLEGRRQLTSVRGARSDFLELGECAVPQGSVMGNNLFLILMNDFTTATDDAEFVMYADDGCVIVSASNQQELRSKLTKVMNEVASWFSVNGMILNVEKTNIIQFCLRGKKEHNLNIYCNNELVPQVDEVKYLGLIIDSGLTWNPHTDSLCDRLSSACFALSRLRPSLHPTNVRKAYFGYFHALLTYGIELWATSANRDRIFKLQKRAVRCIRGVPWDHPARELFKDTKILTLPSLYILDVAKYVRGNLEQFPTRGDSHNYNTRRRGELRPPCTRLAKSKKCLHSIGPKIYNHLPLEIKSATSNKGFMNKLKAKLMSEAYYSVDEFFNGVHS